MKPLILLLLSAAVTAADSKLDGSWVFDPEATVEINLTLYQALNPGMSREQMLAAQRVITTTFEITPKQVIWNVGDLPTPPYAIVDRWDDGFGEVFVRTEYENGYGEKVKKVFSFDVSGDTMTHYGRTGRHMVVNCFKRKK